DDPQCGARSSTSARAPAWDTLGLMGDGKERTPTAGLAETLGLRTRPDSHPPRSRPASENVETLPAPSQPPASQKPASVRGSSVFPAGSRYERVRELGRGGMGHVDEVLDRALGRTVAVKACLAGAGDALLVAEAQICAQLEHPSIVPVHDIGFDDASRPY